MAPEAAEQIWDALMAAGRSRGIRAIGSQALNMARIEAGFLSRRMSISFPRNRRFAPAATARRSSSGSPGWSISRRATSPAAARCSPNGSRGPRRQLVGLDVAGNKPAHNALLYDEAKGKREIGSVTSATWSPTCKRNIALAMVDAPYFQMGTTVWADIYLNRELVWERRMSRAQVVERPFFAPERRRATPAGRVLEPRAVAAAEIDLPIGPWLDPDAKPQIVIEGVSKTFGAFTAVDSVNLRIFKGEMFALVGASGCGKTTLLRMLAGFANPSARPHPDRGCGHDRRAAARAAGQHDVPVVRACFRT